MGNCLVTKLKESVNGDLSVFDAVKCYLNSDSVVTVSGVFIDGNIPAVIDGNGYFTNANGDNLGKEIILTNPSIYEGASFKLSAGNYKVYIKEKQKISELRISVGGNVFKINTEDLYGMSTLQDLSTTNLNSKYNLNRSSTSFRYISIWHDTVTGILTKSHVANIRGFLQNSPCDYLKFNVIDIANPALKELRLVNNANATFCTIEEFVLEIIRQQREAGESIGGSFKLNTISLLTLNGVECRTDNNSTLTFTEHHITITNTNPAYNYEADI